MVLKLSPLLLGPPAGGENGIEESATEQARLILLQHSGKDLDATLGHCGG